MINILKLVTGEEIIVDTDYDNKDGIFETIKKPLRFSVNQQGAPTFVLWLISIDESVCIYRHGIIGRILEKDIPQDLINEYIKNTSVAGIEIVKTV